MKKRYLLAIFIILILLYTPLSYAWVAGGSSGTTRYYAVPSIADQGDTTGRSVKNIIDGIGTTKKATLVFAHSSNSTTTDYTFTTAETITDNITIEIEPGAYIDGNATLTIYSPENIKASPKQRIFGTIITIVFTKPGEIFSSWYGDTGDGSTNDTSAIQAAIDCAEATHASNVIKNSYLHNCPTVYIPSGNHIVTGLTVTAQIMIKGEGNQSTYLSSVTDSTIIDVSSMDDTVNYQPPVFRDFAIFGDPNLTSQIGINAALHCRLENMVISWVGSHGFKSTNGNTTEILYSKIQNNGGYGIYLTGTYNTNCHIVGNVIRENRVGIYMKPSSGTLTTGYILNNLIESNVAVKGSRANTSQVGDPNSRTGVGIWLENVQYLVIENNYFENQLNDIYGETGVSFCRFLNNHHGGSLNVPEDFTGHGGPFRKMQNITIVSGQGNSFEGCRFNRPVKPGTTSASDWGTVFDPNTGTITDVDDGFGYLTHVASIELTSGDVAKLGITEGSWIHITDITGTVGTDSSYGLNDHSFQVVGVSGEKLAIEHTDLTGLTYTSGGTVQIATTWSYDYEHIRPGTRGIIKDCVWQADSGTVESIILRYSDEQNNTVINTGKASGATKYHEQGPLYMVYGSPRTVSNMWQGYYYKYFNKISAIDAKHQFYALPNEKHFFEFITTNVAGESSQDAIEAFTISQNGLSFTTEILTADGAVSVTTPSTKLGNGGAPFAITLADGHYVGQIKAINMSADAGDVTLTIAHHELGSSYQYTFDDVYDFIVLVWAGLEWVTIYTSCSLSDTPPLILNYFGVDYEATDAYSITITPDISSYMNGMHFYFDANTPNDGACTLNVNSIGAKAIKTAYDQTPTNNCIIADSIVHVVYDSSQDAFQMLSPCAYNYARVINISDSNYNVENYQNKVSFVLITASTNRTATLPSTEVGLEYTFMNSDPNSNSFMVDPDGSELFRGSSAGYYKSLDSDGALISIKCLESGIWEILYTVGTITDEP